MKPEFSRKKPDKNIPLIPNNDSKEELENVSNSITRTFVINELRRKKEELVAQKEEHHKTK